MHRSMAPHCERCYHEDEIAWKKIVQWQPWYVVMRKITLPGYVTPLYNPFAVRTCTRWSNLRLGEMVPRTNTHSLDRCPPFGTIVNTRKLLSAVVVTNVRKLTNRTVTMSFGRTVFGGWWRQSPNFLPHFGVS